MYIYYNHLIIREGTEGIPPEKIHQLFVNAGWSSHDLPIWQMEKYALSLKNSTWAFTVWDKEEMIGMVRVISDLVMYANILDLVVLDTYRGRGIGKALVNLCIQKLPHATWYAFTNAQNYSFYNKCGFDVDDPAYTAACTYFGYRHAKEQGHRG